MTKPWHERVQAYVERLSENAETIDLILDQTRVNTNQVKSAEVEASTAELTDAIGELEAMVACRDDLLHAADAPPQGLTLTEKLLSTRHIDHARLAKRCQEVSEQVKTTHERAVSLFVCQYHLASLGSDLLELLSGAIGPKTYDKGSQNKTPGGGLFNEAA